jgi:hypothetical protein
MRERACEKIKRKKPHVSCLDGGTAHDSNPPRVAQFGGLGSLIMQYNLIRASTVSAPFQKRTVSKVLRKAVHAHLTESPVIIALHVPQEAKA